MRIPKCRSSQRPLEAAGPERPKLRCPLRRRRALRRAQRRRDPSACVFRRVRRSHRRRPRRLQPHSPLQQRAAPLRYNDPSLQSSCSYRSRSWSDSYLTYRRIPRRVSSTHAARRRRRASSTAMAATRAISEPASTISITRRVDTSPSSCASRAPSADAVSAGAVTRCFGSRRRRAWARRRRRWAALHSHRSGLGPQRGCGSRGGFSEGRCIGGCDRPTHTTDRPSTRATRGGWSRPSPTARATRRCSSRCGRTCGAVAPGRRRGSVRRRLQIVRLSRTGCIWSGYGSPALLLCRHQPRLRLRHRAGLSS